MKDYKKEIDILKSKLTEERIKNERLRGSIQVLKQNIEETSKRLKSLLNFDNKEYN